MLTAVRKAVVVGGLMVVCGVNAWGQAELAGTWKVNMEKSTFPYDVLHITAAEGGAMRIDSGGDGYTFRTDGTPVVRPMKTKVVMTWTKEGEMHYTTHFSYKGKELKSTVFEVSADNRTMTETDSVTENAPIPKVRSYERVGTGQGLVGDWRNLEDQAMHAKYGYRITDNGDGSVKFETTTWTGESAETLATLEIRADGKPASPMGAKVTKGVEVTMTKTGPRAYAMQEKLKGKDLTRFEYALSGDGKTLTETIHDPGAMVPDVAVYDKK